MDLRISDIQIMPVPPKDGMVAMVSFILNGYLSIGSVAIFTSFTNPLGYRLCYPDKVLRNGARVHCVCPITKEAGRAINEAVIDKYKMLIAGSGEGRNTYQGSNDEEGKERR